MSTIIEIEASKITNAINFAKLKDKSILITGASGLVGLFLISSLKRVQKDLNISITAWVNNEVPDFIETNFKNCNIIKGDITDIEIFKKIPQFDYVIHSAGYGQPIKFVKNKVKTIQINTESTTRLFNLLKKEGTFLFISSSEIYNGLETVNITEDMMGNTNTNHFRSCYIEGKKCGESICQAFTEDGYNVKIARLSLAYGPGTRRDDERVINTFIKKGLQNDSINLMDNGSAIRTYCYITDAVEMLWNIALNGRETVYNVGGVTTTSIVELANTIGKLINKPVQLPSVLQPLEGNPKIVNISCARYITEFNKTVFVPLKEGIEKTINWYKLIFNYEN